MSSNSTPNIWKYRSPFNMVDRNGGGSAGIAIDNIVGGDIGSYDLG